MKIRRLQQVFASEKGFSLVELLGVGAIMAILAAVAIPTIMGSINQTKLNAAKDSISQMASAMHRYAAASADATNNGTFPLPSTNAKVTTEDAWIGLNSTWATGYWNKPSSPNYTFDSYFASDAGDKFFLCVKAKNSGATLIRIDETGSITADGSKNCDSKPS